MKQFWEELDEKDLEILENSLDDNMKYEGPEMIIRKFWKSQQEASQADKFVKKRPGKKVRKKKWYFVLAAVLVLICGAGAAAAYGTWRLPQPETYEGDHIKIKETSSYIWDEKKQTYVDGNTVTETSAEDSTVISSENTTSISSEDETNVEELPDEYFIDQTQKILELIGVSDVDISQMTVAYQIDEWWNREEVEVSFPLEDEDSTTTITFDRESGYFLSADRFRLEEENGEVMSDEEALAAAQGWYEKLPYPQGYEYTYVNKICEDADWMYSFCRKLDVEINGESIQLNNDYEEARITIDPKTGDFVCCNVFYVPLLDDHKEDDVPLSEEKAREIADQAGVVSTEKTDVEVTAEIRIVHPNYMFTSYGWRPGQETVELQDTRMLSVTRLAWVITYKTSSTEGEDFVYLYIDLYTGEILGGDATR